MRTLEKQKSANRYEPLAEFTRKSLKHKEVWKGMVGPEGLEPPTKRL